MFDCAFLIIKGWWSIEIIEIYACGEIFLQSFSKANVMYPLPVPRSRMVMEFLFLEI